MAACNLERVGIDAVITGEISPAIATDLAQHLAGECVACPSLMQAAGLDEETLLMLLIAAREQQPAADRIDGLWQKIAGELPASNVVSLRPVRSTPMRKRLWGRPQVWAAVPMLAAAAVLLMVVLPEGIGPPGDGGGTIGLKGSAALPDAALLVRDVDIAGAANGSVAGLHYDLERDSAIALFHWRPGAKPTQLFAGQSPAATDGSGRFPSGSGYLAYRFDDEPGRHLFVLCVSDDTSGGAAFGTMGDALFDALFDSAWFEAPQHETHIEGEVAGRAVGVHAVRVNVLGAVTTP